MTNRKWMVAMLAMVSVGTIGTWAWALDRCPDRLHEVRQYEAVSIQIDGEEAELEGFSEATVKAVDHGITFQIGEGADGEWRGDLGPESGGE